MPYGDSPPDQRPLRADRALLHEEGACLPLRSRHGQCRACAEACPVGALQVSLAEVVLGDACMACGRCVAACPTEALMLPALQPLLQVPVPVLPPESTVRIECRMVPESHRAPGAIELPCLGVLRPGQLLSYHVQGVGVEVVDRGWCPECPAGNGAAGCAGQEAVETARLWLESLGEDRLPRVVDQPLPQGLRPAEPPSAPPPPQRLDRRSFFRVAMERPAGRRRAAPTPMGGDGRAAYPAERRHPSPERERLLAALERLAELRQRSLPSELFAQITVHDTCCDRRLCVALCPTAALTVVDDGAQVHLRLSGESCIACGVCERACPEAALDMQPFGGAPGTQTLITHTRLHCTSCGDAYSPDPRQGEGVSQLCPSCAKSQRFMEDARRQLFGRAH